MQGSEWVDQVGQSLSHRNRVDLLDSLEGASLEVWGERNEALALVDEDFAEWYPLMVGRLTVAIDRFDGLAEGDVNVLADAVAAVVGPLDDFAVVQGDPPDEAYATPAPRAATPSEWHGMMFRSKSELAIAQALERINVAFFPNARGRLGQTADARQAREPDFLVVYRGKVGVLEVDGGDYHRGLAADDHERDRLFRHHGIAVVERFPAHRCFNFPDDVVGEFLRLLDANG
jgi:hypothetical protein